MTVYTITFNEEIMLPYFIKHYRDRFPDCNIVVYDNQSTDKTQQIAMDSGCSIVEYNTGGKLSDTAYLNIKNNCWKNQNGWVIVADCDELIDINQNDLFDEEMNGTTIISSRAYNMVNLVDDLNIDNINHGVRSTSYDKVYCFDAYRVSDVNYNPGAHTCNPVGVIKYSQNTYIVRHYKYINLEHMIARHKLFASRLSEENIKKGYGGHYLYPADQITTEFMTARDLSTPVLNV